MAAASFCPIESNGPAVDAKVRTRSGLLLTILFSCMREEAAMSALYYVFVCCLIARTEGMRKELGCWSGKLFSTLVAGLALIIAGLALIICCLTSATAEFCDFRAIIACAPLRVPETMRWLKIRYYWIGPKKNSRILLVEAGWLGAELI